MSHDPQQPHRRSVRLKDYDYRSPGAYFVTICTINRACLFGMVEDGAMRLSEEGMVAEREWLRSAEMRRELALDEFVVMPNHVHGIVLLLDTGDGRIDGRATIAGRPPDAPTASVRWFAWSDDQRL
jgi:REP-associated tyrosine transposase